MFSNEKMLYLLIVIVLKETLITCYNGSKAVVNKFRVYLFIALISVMTEIQKVLNSFSRNAKMHNPCYSDSQS